jgi:uncharacterized membrane protein YvbJ
MYCSVCGSQSAPGLKFCNSCGARMIDDSSDVRNSVAKTFALASILTGVFGIIGFAVMIKALLDHGGFKDSFVLLMSLVYLGGLALIIVFLVKQVLKMIGLPEAEREREEEAGPGVPLFKAAETGKLNEYHEPASSVVENTTRDLSKIASERD